LCFASFSLSFLPTKRPLVFFYLSYYVLQNRVIISQFYPDLIIKLQISILSHSQFREPLQVCLVWGEKREKKEKYQWMIHWFLYFSFFSLSFPQTKHTIREFQNVSTFLLFFYHWNLQKEYTVIFSNFLQEVYRYIVNSSRKIRIF
jgi:hypothetical protein